MADCGPTANRAVRWPIAGQQPTAGAQGGSTGGTEQLTEGAQRDSMRAAEQPAKGVQRGKYKSDGEANRGRTGRQCKSVTEGAQGGNTKAKSPSKGAQAEIQPAKQTRGQYKSESQLRAHRGAVQKRGNSQPRAHRSAAQKRQEIRPAERQHNHHAAYHPRSWRRPQWRSRSGS